MTRTTTTRTCCDADGLARKGSVEGVDGPPGGVSPDATMQGYVWSAATTLAARVASFENATRFASQRSYRRLQLESHSSAAIRRRPPGLYISAYCADTACKAVVQLPLSFPGGTGVQLEQVRSHKAFILFFLVAR